MRTTVDLPDDLYRELKAVAARRGISLQEIVRAAVVAELCKSELRSGRRMKFPILSSRQPATLNLTSAEIDDLLA